ncbi:MAG TPA: diacylglycerol kinase family protein [Polyangiaceae bacterium]|nr:diacylglycerol kinase family protein [Polyangiaceae bacterium]
MTGVTHLLVGNPTAQSGKNQARIERARHAFSRAGVDCDFLATEPDGRTIQAVTRALDGGAYECVVYMGGDGTFREVASGILDSKRREEVTLGMLPTGTANDQGRSFGLAAGDDALDRNIEVVLGGYETRLDAGRLEAPKVAPAWFFDSAGWGISARVLRERNIEREVVSKIPILREVYRDQLVYAGVLLRVFLDSYVVSDKFDAEIEADGEHVELTGLTDLIVKGTRVYGGAWVFDRHAAHDDGRFEVVPFRGKRDWTSKAIVDFDGNPVTEEMLNAVGIEHSRPFSASRIDIRFRVPTGGAPFAAQIDGEELAADEHVRIAVHRQALRLVIPS